MTMKKIMFIPDSFIDLARSHNIHLEKIDWDMFGMKGYDKKFGLPKKEQELLIKINMVLEKELGLIGICMCQCHRDAKVNIYKHNPNTVKEEVRQMAIKNEIRLPSIEDHIWFNRNVIILVVKSNSINDYREFDRKQKTNLVNVLNKHFNDSELLGLSITQSLID